MPLYRGTFFSVHKETAIMIQAYLLPLPACVPIHNCYMKEQQTSAVTMYTCSNAIILLPTASFSVRHDQSVMKSHVTQCLQVPERFCRSQEAAWGCEAIQVRRVRSAVSPTQGTQTAQDNSHWRKEVSHTVWWRLQNGWTVEENKLQSLLKIHCHTKLSKSYIMQQYCCSHQPPVMQVWSLFSMHNMLRAWHWPPNPF